MSLSILYRLLLLVLLPVIAVVVYLEGQRYDPGLIRFQSSESTADPMLSFLHDRIGAFTRINAVRSFTKENLYEYVNGHAEYYISAGFKGLAVGDYRAKGSSTNDPDVVVEIYDMGKSIHAFSILSDESEGSESSVQSGETVFTTSQGISFIHGKYYVKVQAYSEGIALDFFKEDVIRRMGSTDQAFSGFARFPDIGKLTKTRFIREAYLGIDFLNHVIEREYRVNEKIFKLALFAEDKTESKTLITSFTGFFMESEIPYTVTENKGNAVYKVSDPYEGDWVLIAAGGALFGLYGTIDDGIIEMVLE